MDDTLRVESIAVVLHGAIRIVVTTGIRVALFSGVP
jgi:hypothetical protein